MSEPAPAGAEATCLASLESALGSEDTVPDLGGVAPPALERALQALGKRHGAAAGRLLRRLAEEAPVKEQRKAARRVIYRLTQSGVLVPPPPAPPVRVVVTNQRERPVSAWLSGIDGTGSRAIWILFEGGVGGGLVLCSLIVNDEIGIVEVTAGPITRKRLDHQIDDVRGQQTLGWIPGDPAHAIALVLEALALHAREGTQPPAELTRWRRLFDITGTSGPERHEETTPAEDADPGLLERSAELLEAPELLGWFVDPASIQEDALALLQARESRLVVSDQIKAEREAAIVDAVIDRVFTSDVAGRWARRLREMAPIFRATGRDSHAALARASAAALERHDRPARAIPLVRALAMRGLDMAGEVALGRAKLAEVSRAPRRRARP